MVTRKATAPAELDFNSLLETATVEVRKSGSKDRYLPADQVNESVTKLVKDLYASEGKKRLSLKVSGKPQYDSVHAQFSSAAHHLNLSANVRSVYEGEGEDAKTVGVTITVTDKRGSKPKAAAPTGD